MNYRLKGIEVAGFRGFNDIQYCSLDNPLVLLYAPNGHGKSSLCEAIEWAIYGNNTRRTRGERDIQKREFEHSLRNRHYPADSEAYVTLYLYNDSNDVEIKRVIDQEEGPGVLYVDGNQVNDLSALGVSGEVRHPLILQHGIRDFVFAKPAERFSLISAQLGMGALNALQASIQNASRSFKTKPEDISKGQTLRADLIELCSTVPDMSPIKDELVRWTRLFEQ